MLEDYSRGLAIRWTCKWMQLQRPWGFERRQIYLIKLLRWIMKWKVMMGMDLDLVLCSHSKLSSKPSLYQEIIACANASNLHKCDWLVFLSANLDGQWRKVICLEIRVTSLDTCSQQNTHAPLWVLALQGLGIWMASSAALTRDE